MSLIEQPRILVTDVPDDDVLVDHGASAEPSRPVDIAREALRDEALERAREEWAAPPKHR